MLADPALPKLLKPVQALPARYLMVRRLLPSRLVAGLVSAEGWSAVRGDRVVDPLAPRRGPTCLPKGDEGTTCYRHDVQHPRTNAAKDGKAAPRRGSTSANASSGGWTGLRARRCVGKGAPSPAGSAGGVLVPSGHPYFLRGSICSSSWFISVLPALSSAAWWTSSASLALSGVFGFGRALVGWP